MSLEIIKKKTDAVYYIKILIMLLLMGGFGYLPAIEPLSDIGMRTLGIFLGALFGWCFIGILMPSIFAMMAMVLFEVNTVSQVMSTGWGNKTTMLIFFMMVIAALTKQSGVSNFLAVYFISKKWVLGKPWLFTLTFLLTTYFIAAFTATIPSILVCWAIFYGVCEYVGYEKHETFPTYMVICIVIVATIGTALFPFKLVGVLVFGMLKNLSGIDVDYATYTAFTLIIGLLSTAVLPVMGKFIFRIDVSKLQSLTEDAFRNVNLSLTKIQKAVIFFMLALVFLLLLPSFLPESSFMYVILKRFDSVGIAAVLIGIMCMIRIEGEPILDFRKVASGGIQWDVLFLTATVMPLSSVIGAEESGITQLLVNILSPILAGKSAFVFLSLVVVMSIICTQFCVNNVVGAMLLPVFYPFSLQLGIKPLAVAALLAYSCHFALLTPSASPMAALLYGNSEWCTVKDIIRYGVPIIIVSALVCCIVGIPLCQIIL